VSDGHTSAGQEGGARNSHAPKATTNVSDTHVGIDAGNLGAAVRSNVRWEVCVPVHVGRGAWDVHGGIVERIAVCALPIELLLRQGAGLHDRSLLEQVREAGASPGLMW
jgi:hypothetical protein